MSLRAAFLLALLAPAAQTPNPNPNPKLAALALAVPATSVAPAVRYDHPMADTLVWLLAKLRHHDYQGLGDRVGGRIWLGADKQRLTQEENGPELELNFGPANPRGKAAVREAKAAFKRLVAGGPFRPAGVFSHSLLLEENGQEAFEYYTPPNAPDGYLLLTIHAYVPPDYGLADEAAYHGQSSGTVAATDAPQVWEVRGRGSVPDSYQRYKGVFKNGVLVRGSKTFHGYGDYLDGVWLSNHWTEPTRPGPGTGKVEFHPAGTTDLVYGSFRDDGLQDFDPDVRHSTTGRDVVSGGFRPDAPVWLRENYLTHNYRQYLARKAAEEQRADQYARDHPQQPGTAPTYARPNDPARTYQPTLHEVACGVCGGSGWVSGRNYGQRDQCGSCGGRGKVMSKY